MSELDDLKTAAQAITKAVAGAAAELSKLAEEVKELSSTTPIDPEAVEQVAKDLQTQADALTLASGTADTTANPPSSAPTT